MNDTPSPVACAYCDLKKAPPQSDQLIRFGQTSGTTLYLHRDQSLPGRMIIATQSHFSDITELTDDVQKDLFDTMRQAARAVREIYPSTAKITIAIGGTLPQYNHPHVHLVPRHVGDRRWPDFALDVQQPFWPANDDRYQKVIGQLLSHPKLAGRVQKI